MKKTLFIALSLLSMLLVSAVNVVAEEEALGTVSYIQGDMIETFIKGQTGNKILKQNDPVFTETTIRTKLAQRVDVTWKADGSVSIIDSNQTVKIGELWEQHVQDTLTPLEKLWHNVSKLVKTEDGQQRPTTVAATRGDGVGLKQTYWKVTEPKLKDGLDQFENKEYEASLVSLTNVIKNDPFSNDAAIALLTKGIALSKLNRTVESKEAFTLFLKDFPDHAWAKMAREALDQLNK